MARKKKYWWACARIALASFLLLLIGLVVSSSRLNFVDEAAVDIVYGLQDWLTVFFDSISQVGSVGAFIGASAGIIILKR